MRNRIIHVIFIAVGIVIFTGCYHDYLVIHSEYKSPVIANDSSKIFFFHFLEVGQPPKGISRFPDGGTYKDIYRNISLYSFDIKNNVLNKIHDFGNIPFLSLEHISVQKDNIVFSLSPLMGWNWVKSHKSDSTYNKIYNKYAGFYKYDFDNKSLNRFVNEGFYPELSQNENQIIYLKRDTNQITIWHLDIKKDINQKIITLASDSPFNLIKWHDEYVMNYKYNKSIYEYNLKNKTSHKIDYDVNFYPSKIPIKKVKKLTTNISYKEWGFDLEKYWNKNAKILIRDIIELNGNLNYRKAILQSISHNLSKKDIENILQKMDKYQNSLEGLEKTEYKLYSKETKALLKSYL
ncbi:MAG: hypothetical protein KQH79_10355 [Bacteroidetes bacterium]|nr:hypothetical protein [Bacteroidota bacterium]